MKIRTKLLSMAAATVLVATITGCDGDTSKSTSVTGSSATHITNPKGSVTGLVQDTNGNPITGATIYLAGLTTTTDAGGQYRFNNVPVTNTETSNSGDTNHQSLSVTIVPPTGYVGATVTVKPAAQLDGAEDGATNGTETFIDGYIASAGVAVLPATNSTVTGTLRDLDTGAPLASKEVRFEFVAGGSGADVDQEQTQNGVTTSYAVTSYKVTTDANGVFSFASLPSDSAFKTLVAGYDVSHTFTSNDEDTITLGNVFAEAITALDNVNPYVVSVNGVIADGARAMLDDDTRNTFVVNFSETLDAAKLELAGNSVLLYGGKPNQLTSIPFTASIDSANKTITVTTTATLADGDHVDILFLNADAVDISHNPLTTSGVIAFDDTVQGKYTRVKLEIFEEANTNAPAVTVSAQLNEDTLGSNDDEAIQAKSDAFLDVLDDTAGFQQLNSSDDDNSNGTADAQERLNALAVALGASGVATDKSRISFTPSGAYGYMISVADKAGSPKIQNNILGVLNATTSNVDTVDSIDFDGAATAMVLATDANPVEIYLSNVAPTDVVTITPIDSLGYMGTATPIVLADTVAPTTVLQKSYFAGAATSGEDSSGAVVQFGDGGELADANGALVVGTPYLAINNSLLDNEDANGELVATGVNPDQALKTELYDLGVVDTTGTGKIYLDGLAAYDAQAIAAFNQTSALGRKMGVAFSEDIETIGTTPVFTGATALSGWTINNDVTTNVSGATVNVDLIDMDVANVLALANTDHLETITYNGIVDASGNTATAATNAAVVVKDEMAPLVLSATYSEATANVVITFNEPITLTDAAVAPAVNSAVSINGITATYSASATSNQWTLGSGNTVLTIPAAAFSGAINNRTLWAAGTTYAYPNDNYAVGATEDLSHGILDFSAISDVHGNSWDSYATKTVARAVENPRFATAEITSVFGAGTPSFGATDTTTTTQVVTWTLSHPVRVTNAADIFFGVTPTTAGYVLDGNNAADLAKILAAFTGVIDPTGANTTDALTNFAGDPTTLTLSNNRKTLTLRFRTTTDLTGTAGDIVRLNTKTLVSDGDTDQSLSGDALKATAQ